MLYNETGNRPVPDLMNRRIAAALIDLVPVSIVIYTIDIDAFSGVLAVLFSFGAYRVVAEWLFHASAGKAILGLRVRPDNTRSLPWILRCLIRESPLWVPAALGLSLQGALASSQDDRLDGAILALILAILGLQVSAIVLDIVFAQTRAEGHALHDVLAGTRVVRVGGAEK